MAPHAGSATPEQINALLNFLDEHKDLARRRLRGADGNVQAKSLWEELCNSLNSMGGCTNTIQQWQKVWFDRKHHANKKAAADSRSTGLQRERLSFSLVQPQFQLSLDLPEVMEYVIASQENSLSTKFLQPLMSQSQTPRSSSQPAPSRRRQSAAGSDVRS